MNWGIGVGYANVGAIGVEFVVGDPHEPQNCCPGTSSVPQVGQFAIIKVS
jgi:hypothetical protein